MTEHNRAALNASFPPAEMSLSEFVKRAQIPSVHADSTHTCPMLMIAFLDEPQMVWMVLLGFLPLGLISLILDKVHMVPLCSVTLKNSIRTVRLEKSLFRTCLRQWYPDGGKKGALTHVNYLKIVDFFFVMLSCSPVSSYMIIFWLCCIFSAKFCILMIVVPHRGVVIREIIFNSSSPVCFFQNICPSVVCTQVFLFFPPRLQSDRTVKGKRSRLHLQSILLFSGDCNHSPLCSCLFMAPFHVTLRITSTRQMRGETCLWRHVVNCPITHSRIVAQRWARTVAPFAFKSPFDWTRVAITFYSQFLLLWNGCEMSWIAGEKM